MLLCCACVAFEREMRGGWQRDVSPKRKRKEEKKMKEEEVEREESIMKNREWRSSSLPLPEEVTFRTVRREDVGSLRELQEELFPVRYREEFYDNLFDRGVEAIVAVRPTDGRVVGAVTSRVTESTATVWDVIFCRKEAYVMTLGVAADHRRRGLASELLSQLRRRLRENSSISTISLHVQASNDAAIAFYLSRGFLVHHREENYYSFDGDDPLGRDRCPHALFMRSPLDPLRVVPPRFHGLFCPWL